jgi:hypothetical protein
MRRCFTVFAAILLLAGLAGFGAAEPAPAAEGTASYYVNRNAQQSGDHEVHTTTCKHGAQEQNRLYLGRFASCEDAVRAAREHYRQSDGCAYCAAACDHG